MATRIRLEVIHGSRFVKPDDTQRALDAAHAAILAENLADHEALEAAYAVYLEDPGADTPFARVQRAADLALTEDWHDPDGASLVVLPA